MSPQLKSSFFHRPIYSLCVEGVPELATLPTRTSTDNLWTVKPFGVHPPFLFWALPEVARFLFCLYRVIGDGSTGANIITTQGLVHCATLRILPGKFFSTVRPFKTNELSSNGIRPWILITKLFWLMWLQRAVLQRQISVFFSIQWSPALQTTWFTNKPLYEPSGSGFFLPFREVETLYEP